MPEGRVRFSISPHLNHRHTDEHAITEYLRVIGFDYKWMLEENMDMLFVDAHAAYHASAHFGDTLRVHCRAGIDPFIRGHSPPKAAVGLLHRGCEPIFGQQRLHFLKVIRRDTQRRVVGIPQQ